MEEEEPYYAFPSLDYLIPPESQIEDTEWLESQSEKLEEALSHFAVKATVIEAMQGPTVTRFELTVGVGTKVSKVRNLTDDLKLALGGRRYSDSSAYSREEFYRNRNTKSENKSGSDFRSYFYGKIQYFLLSIGSCAWT